ncbi:MAG TPA: glutathione S-transferase family protein [Gaiellaceae bacterium]|nr:glutathione S-transferase family protein [Gaiellaceae bacterium]
MRLYDYAASGNCYKARLLLALLDRPYERVAVDIFAGDTLTDEFGLLNPVRETPVLVLDSGEVITQSNAILWYLGEGTSYLPESTVDRARVVQWLAFEQERVMAGVGGARFRRITGREALDPEGVASRYALGEEALGVLEQQLADREFVVGDRCSIADVSLFAYTHVAGDAGYDLRRLPAVAAWLERVRAEPGFVDDLVPYGANARPGAGRSIYD